MTALFEHLTLVLWSTTAAVIVGVPLGIVAERRPRAGIVILSIISVLQVIPSLALFGFLLPIPIIGGIGGRTAGIALVIYALLPIVRSTKTGIAGISASIRESAIAIGMTSGQRLLSVELPLALPVIASGVRTALVIGVGVATIAAAIGAGGFGTLIFRGLRMNDNRAMLTGALGAAGLALSLDLLFALFVRRISRRRSVLLFALLPLALIAGSFAMRQHRGSVVVCCKDFSEQVFLGESLARALESRGIAVTRQFELGGNLCHEALLAGTVDVYPEYTGTALISLLREPLGDRPEDRDAKNAWTRVRDEYARRWNLEVSAPIGFANDFAILVRADFPGTTISDLAARSPQLRAGFGQDFMSRPDGYEGFARAYGLRFAVPPQEMDLALTYRALAAGKLDVIAGNSTDGLIDELKLKLLVDDKHYFPPYEAVWISRRAVEEKLRAAIASIHFSTEEMRRINDQALQRASAHPRPSE